MCPWNGFVAVHGIGNANAAAMSKKLSWVTIVGKVALGTVVETVLRSAPSWYRTAAGCIEVHTVLAGPGTA